MEILSNSIAELRKAHKLAKKHYESGDYPNALAQYEKCARLSEQVSKISSERSEKEHYKAQAQKFREIASGIKNGNMKVYTGGVKPPQEPVSKQESDSDEELSQKAQELILVEKPSIRFKDIAGLDSVKEQIKESIVYPFLHPETYEYYGVTAGGGILLYGPPGCGKTMMAAAAAAECDAIFINIKISDIKDKYVGESEKKIKEVFKLARDYEKSIIFFDEIDAIASDRSGSSEGHEKSLVNELLAQMDGVDTKGSNKYLILAATNIPWSIDTALRRPGRFDKSIFIPQPDLAARKKLFEIYLKNKPVSKNVSVDELAKLTIGFASAEILYICQETAKIPLREAVKGKAKREITMDDFNQVLSKTQTILASWYPKALREVKSSGEEGIFAELIKAGQRYTKPV